MADAILIRHSALEGLNSAGRFGAAKNNVPGITLQEQPALSIVQVDAWTDRLDQARAGIERAIGLLAPDPVRAAENSAGTKVLSIGPARWLVTEPEHRDLMAVLAAAIPKDDAVLVDQGHSRVCWRLSGPHLRDLLVKGSTLDFEPHAFRPGDCVGTALGHFTVTIHSRFEDSVDLYGARSYAVDLNHWLRESALEFGMDVLEPARISR